MIESLPLILTGIGIIVSILYYASVLRNANRTRELQLKAQKQAVETRQAALFMSIYETHTNPEFRKKITEIQQQTWNNLDEFIEKFGPESNPDAYSNRIAVSSFFEGIGFLVKRDLVDISMVHNLLGISVVHTWEKIGPVFIDARVRVNEPYLYLDFEYLYNEILKYRKSLTEIPT
jgi:hypothetical protein